MMCLVAGQMKKLLQKVPFRKSNKQLFQLFRLLGYHKYMNLLNFSFTGGHVRKVMFYIMDKMFV